MQAKKICEHCGKLGCRPEYHLARCKQCGGIGDLQQTAIAWPDGRTAEAWLHPQCQAKFIATAEQRAT
jgi:DnaJ-class molecular chaperone